MALLCLMLSRRIPAVLAGVLLGSLLAVPLTSSPAYAGTRVQFDNDDFDVLHRDIDMDKLKVTYDGKGVRATITMKDLEEEEPAPDLRGDGDPGVRRRPELAGVRPPRRVPAQRAPQAEGRELGRRLPTSNGYVVEKCAGVKVKANYKRDTLKYKLPNRCARFDLARGYVDTWASARKFSRASWDEGSPAATTGDWFDTTYDLVVLR